MPELLDHVGTIGLAAVVTFVGLFIGVPIVIGVLRLFGLFTIVRERECKVFVLFGKVIGQVDEPGFVFLPARLGMRGFIVNLFGRTESVDLRIDQEYLRSQPVNSEEGAPMGIGVWYEMFVSDPVAYLFKNTDPRGSLSANVTNAAVRTLSNLPLEKMLVDRHPMSRTVRDDVSPKSNEWGYRLGSVYVRKVHFRDVGMIRQIEEKVVNRLRQVTSAIKQDGANQVSLITSAAERKAAVEFARAAAMRPQIVGATLREIQRDPEVARSLFAVLETQKLMEGEASIVLLPEGREHLLDLVASEATRSPSTPSGGAHPATPRRAAD